MEELLASLQGATQVISQAKAAVAGLGQDLGKVVASMTAVSVAAGVAGQAVDALVGTIRSSISRFVEFFDPGRVQLFEVAVRDLYATLGRALQPALEVATHLIKRIADAFAAFSPPGKGVVEAAKRIIDAFGPIIDLFVQFANEVSGVLESALADSAGSIVHLAQSLADLVRSILQLAMGPELFASFVSALIPVVDIVVQLVRIFLELVNVALIPVKLVAGALAVTLELLAPLLNMLAEGLKTLADTIRDVLVELGLVSDKKPEKGKGTGMAAHQAHFTSAQSYAQTAYASAYGLGKDVNDPAKQSAGYLKEIRDFIKNELPKMLGLDKVADTVFNDVLPAIGISGGLAGAAGKYGTKS